MSHKSAFLTMRHLFLLVHKQFFEYINRNLEYNNDFSNISIVALYINDSTRNTDLPTRIDNISTPYNVGMF